MANVLNKDPFTYAEDRRGFLQDLQRFHASRGTPFDRIPQIGGREIDLYRLYRRVIDLGGWQKVNNDLLWEDIQEEFKVPLACTNGSQALKYIYFRYLNIYEKVHFLGVDPDHSGDDHEDGPARKKVCLPVESIPLTYNYNQHKIQDTQRAASKLSTDLMRFSDYHKLEMALRSGLANEVDFAVNVCLLLSNEGRHVLKLGRSLHLLQLLMANIGIFEEGPSTMEDILLQSWSTGESKRDFLRFWHDTVKDEEIRKNIKTKHGVYKREDMLGCEVLHLGRELGVKDAEGQRVTQLAVLIRNLSFEDVNQQLLASSNLVFRFLMLCVHSSYGTLRQLALDTLGNLAAQMVLQPVENTTTELIMNLIKKSLVEEDKFVIVRALEMLSKLCQLEKNEAILSECLEGETYSRIVQLLTVHDIQLIVHTLEALYQLSELGDTTTTMIANVKNAVDLLVNLITVEAQAYGPNSLIGIKVVEYVPPPDPHAAAAPSAPPMPQPSRTVIQSIAPSQVPPGFPAQPSPQLSAVDQAKADVETTTSNWLQGTFEAKRGSVLTQTDLFEEYQQFCRKFGVADTLTASDFSSIVKSAIPQVVLAEMDKGGGEKEVIIRGLCRRPAPRPFAILAGSDKVCKPSACSVPVNSLRGPAPVSSSWPVSPDTMVAPTHTPTLRQRLMEPPRMALPHQLVNYSGAIGAGAPQPPTPRPTTSSRAQSAPSPKPPSGGVKKRQLAPTPPPAPQPSGPGPGPGVPPNPRLVMSPATMQRPVLMASPAAHPYHQAPRPVVSALQHQLQVTSAPLPASTVLQPSSGDHVIQSSSSGAAVFNKPLSTAPCNNMAPSVPSAPLVSIPSGLSISAPAPASSALPATVADSATSPGQQFPLIHQALQGDVVMGGKQSIDQGSDTNLIKSLLAKKVCQNMVRQGNTTPSHSPPPPESPASNTTESPAPSTTPEPQQQPIMLQQQQELMLQQQQAAASSSTSSQLQVQTLPAQPQAAVQQTSLQHQQLLQQNQRLQQAIQPPFIQQQQAMAQSIQSQSVQAQAASSVQGHVQVHIQPASLQQQQGGGQHGQPQVLQQVLHIQQGQQVVLHQQTPQGQPPAQQITIQSSRPQQQATTTLQQIVLQANPSQLRPHHHQQIILQPHPHAGHPHHQQHVVIQGQPPTLQQILHQPVQQLHIQNPQQLQGQLQIQQGQAGQIQIQPSQGQHLQIQGQGQHLQIQQGQGQHLQIQGQGGQALRIQTQQSGQQPVVIQLPVYQLGANPSLTLPSTLVQTSATGLSQSTMVPYRTIIPQPTLPASLAPGHRLEAGAQTVMVAAAGNGQDQNSSERPGAVLGDLDSRLRAQGSAALPGALNTPSQAAEAAVAGEGRTVLAPQQPHPEAIPPQGLLPAIPAVPAVQTMFTPGLPVSRSQITASSLSSSSLPSAAMLSHLVTSSSLPCSMSSVSSSSLSSTTQRMPILQSSMSITQAILSGHDAPKAGSNHPHNNPPRSATESRPYAASEHVNGNNNVNMPPAPTNKECNGVSEANKTDLLPQGREEVNGILGSPDSVGSDLPPSPMGGVKTTGGDFVPNGLAECGMNSLKECAAQRSKELLLSLAGKGARMNGVVHHLENGDVKVNIVQDGLEAADQDRRVPQPEDRVKAELELAAADKKTVSAAVTMDCGWQVNGLSGHGVGVGTKDGHVQTAPLPHRDREQVLVKQTSMEEVSLDSTDSKLVVNGGNRAGGGAECSGGRPLFSPDGSHDSDLSCDSFASSIADSVSSSEKHSTSAGHAFPKPSSSTISTSTSTPSPGGVYPEVPLVLAGTIPMSEAVNKRNKKKAPAKPKADKPQPTPSAAAKSKKRKTASAATDTATVVMPTAPPPIEYMCEWAGCRRCFNSSRLVYIHVTKMHVPQQPESVCQWLGCEPLRRKRWSLVTHLQDHHCSEGAQRAGYQRRLQAAQTATVTAPQALTSVQQAPALVYPPDAAMQAIKRFHIKPPFAEFAEQREGPVTKHIRLTSALILRNLSRYSSHGRSLIKRCERQLSYVTMSAVESSTALSSCLWEILHDT